MIPLSKLFQTIQKLKKFKKGMLAAHLKLTLSQLNNHLIRNYVPDDLVQPWAEFLEIREQDYSALHQYNQRQRLYFSLPGNNIEAKNLAALLLHFGHTIELSSIKAGILRETMPFMYNIPYEVQNALAELKDE